MEFLTKVIIDLPSELHPVERERLMHDEARQAGNLIQQGRILRLWRPLDESGRLQNIGLWQAPDEITLLEAMATLPLYRWMSVEITQLGDHPSDPGASGSRLLA